MGSTQASYERGDYPYPQSVEARIVAGMGGYTARIRGGTSPAVARRTSSTWWRPPRRTTRAVCCGRGHEAAVRLRPAEPLNLTLAASAVNRQRKSGKDAGEWLPRMNRCWFAARVVAVKRKYRLTVGAREVRALEGVLSRCASTAMVVADGQEPAPTSSPEAPAAGGADALRRWDTNGNGRITCREARAHGIAPVRRGHPAYPFMRDGDGDGVVCE